MTPFKTLVRAQWKGWTRDRASVFFALGFPLIMMALLSLVFGSGINSSPRVLIVGEVAALEGFDDSELDVSRVDDLDSAVAQLEDGEAAAVVSQSGDDVTVRYNESMSIISDAAKNGISNAVHSTNADILEESSGLDSTYSLNFESDNGATTDPIQYLAPGMLGWAIAISGVFNSAGSLVDWKKTKVLRRLRLTPAGAGTVVGSRITVNLLVACVQVAVFAAVAIAVFGLRPTGWAWFSVPLALLGTTMFIAMGVIVGGIAKTAPGAAGLSNLVTMPIAFTSGAFYPIDESPQWLQTVATVNPMRYLNDAIMGVGVEGLNPIDVIPQIAAMLGFTALFALIAWRTFKFDEL
ncbi:ABC transporter permease [Haloglycomyces albus]|uniref:ABC transporter permease n=1 Tax=Haloglycomyces albus TaxID=526067 RepID=UPI00046D3113|nr:ABC transporter permease [Haloglycomyces albus]